MAQKGGIGSHTKPNQGETNIWLTPEFIIEALGPFDLDPCAAPSPRPWPTATNHIELPEDGLAASWCGDYCTNCGWIDQAVPQVREPRAVLEVQEVSGRTGASVLEVPSRKDSPILSECNSLGTGAEHSSEKVYSLFAGQDCKNDRLLPEEASKGRALLILPRLWTRDCSNQASEAPDVSHTEDQAIGREEEIPAVGERARSKAYPERYGEPHPKTAQTIGSLPLGLPPMDRVSEALEPHLRLLRSSESEADTRPFHTAKRPELSRNSSLEHGSSLSELQLQQTEAFPLRLDEGSRVCCPYCGGITKTAPYRTYLNPPYGKEVDAWLEKLSQHKHGIALIFARTETSTWTTHVWPKAHSIFFFDGRLFFHRPDGTRGESNAGGPSALISYSYFDTEAIRHSGLKGTLLEQWVGRAE